MYERYEGPLPLTNTLPSSSQTYNDTVMSFHRMNGTGATNPPVVAGRVVDLLLLSNHVSMKGGFQNVSDSKKWTDIARLCLFDSKSAGQLKTVYSKFVAPFEERNRGVAMVYKSDSEDESRKRVASFSETESPAKRRDVSSDGEKRRAAKVAEVAISDAVDACMICRGIANPAKLLICDGCDRGCHMYCLDPPLVRVPRGKWFCAECEQGKSLASLHPWEKKRVVGVRVVQDEVLAREEWSLYDLHAKATLFQKTHENVEDAFWKFVKTSEFVDGSVLHGCWASPASRGMPFVETDGGDGFARCSWNLNVLPYLPSSALGHLQHDIGLQPKILAGMMFSATPWTLEEHFMPQIKFHHGGDVMTVYAVSGQHAEKFADKFEKRQDVNLKYVDFETLRRKMISPTEILDAGMSVSCIDLQPGEMCVVFSGAFHSSFSHGFNVVESVNFADASWLEHGRRSLDWYRGIGRRVLYSHARLVCACSIAGTAGYSSALVLKEELERVLRDQVEFRNHAGVIGAKEDVWNWETPPPLQYCSKCGVDLSVSYFSNHDQVVCPSHTDHLKGEVKWNVVYGIGVLETALEKIMRVVNRPNEWLDKFHKMTSESPRVSLKVCQTMFAAAYKLPAMPEEAKELGDWISVVEDWLKRCTRVLTAKRRPKKKQVSEWDKRTLHVVEKLLKEADDLSFDVPEIQTLEGFKEDAYTFRQSVEQVMKNETLQGEELFNEVTRLMDVGNKLEVEMNEMELLKDRLQDVLWWKRAHAILQKTPIRMKEISLIVEEARHQGVNPQDQVLMELEKLSGVGQLWMEDALKLKSQRLMTEEDLAKIVARADQEPVDGDLFDFFENVLKRTTDWTSKAKRLLERADAKDRKMPTVRELKSLIDECMSLPVRPLEFAKLRYQLKQVEQWIAVARLCVAREKVAPPMHDLFDNISNSIDTSTEKHCYCRTEDEGLMVCVFLVGKWLTVKKD